MGTPRAALVMSDDPECQFRACLIDAVQRAPRVAHLIQRAAVAASDTPLTHAHRGMLSAVASAFGDTTAAAGLPHDILAQLPEWWPREWHAGAAPRRNAAAAIVVLTQPNTGPLPAIAALAAACETGAPQRSAAPLLAAALRAADSASLSLLAREIVAELPCEALFSGTALL